MLKETRSEKGCFGGCAMFIIVAGALGLIIGFLFLRTIFSDFPSAVATTLGVATGAVGGMVAGGIIGFLWSMFVDKKERQEEEW